MRECVKCQTCILYNIYLLYLFIVTLSAGAEGEGSMGGTEDLDIEVDVVETSEPEDLAPVGNNHRYHHHHHHHHQHHHRSSADAGTGGKQNGTAGGGGGSSKKKRCRETVSASSEDGDRTPPPHDSASAKNLSAMLAKCTSPDLASTECYLESVSKELWTKFHELGTEMIITKTGR